nr:MAG TPA: hypothetical protein [Caudoviricetes sp.]
MIMCTIKDKSNHINVDEWGTEKYPIAPEDILIKSIKDEVIIPVAEISTSNPAAYQQLNYFYMNTKRAYNSDKTRAHICLYLNYFEKFYDTEKELLMVISKIKTVIDYEKDYTVDMFMDDVNRYIIRNWNLTSKIRRFVEDNYIIKLSNNGGKTPNLQFADDHAKILYEVSLFMNIYIPLSTHYMYIHMIKNSKKVQDFMLRLFDLCNMKYIEERGVNVYAKLYETSESIVNKSKNVDKLLWEKNLIRGNNTTTHILDSVDDNILQIMPKYVFNQHIINFNHHSNRKSLHYKITDIEYEFAFHRLSSTDKDADQNSEYDRYESRLNKKDEALSLQNRTAAAQAMHKIEALYGPFDPAEVEYYKKKLQENNGVVIHELTNILLGYLFYKDLGDPITWNSIPNQTCYIKLMIAAKRILRSKGLIILAEVLSSKVSKYATKKSMSKDSVNNIRASELFTQLEMKYNNPKVIQQWFDLLGIIKSSSFIIIDYHNKNIDGVTLPMEDDRLNDEFMKFCLNI